MAGVVAAAARGATSQFSSTRVGDAAVAAAASATPQQSPIDATFSSFSAPSIASTLLYPARLLGLTSQEGGLQWLTTTLVLLATLLALEQYVYRYKKKHLPGATWTIPVIGKFADSLKPTMAAYHKTWSNPLSVASVFNIFIVMASDNALTRKILNSPNHTEPCLTASAKQILIPDNWVFLGGKEHADYRKALNVLFTRRALSTYLRMQETIFRGYFSRWLAHGKQTGQHMEVMFPVRDLNMETSLRVFCGEYIPDEACKAISDKYWLITRALELVNFPLAVPGTKVYKAIQARKIAMKWFMYCSAESKKNMKKGGESTCLLDAWVKEMIEYSKYEQAIKNGEEKATLEKPLLAREYSDHEIAMVLMSFLFASQDAMSSGLTYALQHMADHPDKFAKVRAEQLEVRAGDVNAPFTLEMLEASPYLRAFVKESLRCRPPVIMVPYMAKKAFPINDEYTCPKGSIVIPSFWNSLHDESIYPDADSFKPERFLAGGSSENSPASSYLVFGSGPHKCIGYDYALMHIAATIGVAAVLMDWTHEITPTSDQVQIICTLFPQDGCKLKFTESEMVKRGGERCRSNDPVVD